jgi:hypothetical protein
VLLLLVRGCLMNLSDVDAVFEEQEALLRAVCLLG